MEPLTFFLIWLGTMILTAALTKNQEFDPASAEDITLPMVSQSRRIPLVVGQGLITGPNVLGTGDLKTKAIKVSAGLFGGSKETGAFKYYLDIHTGLAWGPGELLAVYMGDYDLGITPATASGEQFIDKPELWGDKKAGNGGGFKGYVRFNAGIDAGFIDTEAETATGDLQPGYPHVSTVLLYSKSTKRGAYMGNQPTFKALSYKYAFYPDPFTAADAKINGHANPAYFLYELNKNPLWGRDIRGDVDITAITDMAAALSTEGFGWSRTFYDGNSEGMEREALQYVDGVRYRDPLTGKIIYKLVRDDFVVGNLPVLGDNEIADMYIDGDSLSTVATEVSVTYVDVAEEFKRKTITRTNTAVRQQIGRRVPADMEFLGCPNGEIADKIATREARKLGVPKRKGKLWATREIWDWANGDAFVINFTPENLSGMVARVVNIDRGNIVDVNGRVEIEWIEVPFLFGAGVFGDVGSVPTETLTSAPADVSSFIAIELSDFLTETPHKLGLFAADPVGDSYGFDWQIDASSNGTWFDDSDGQFATPATVSTAYDQQALTIILDGELLDVESHTWAAISVNGYNLILLDTANGQEWIAFTSASYNAAQDETTLTGVRRGLLDTYPKALATPDNAWLFDEINISEHTFGSTDDADFRMLDITGQGTLAEGSATTRDFVFNNRYNRPFLPGYIRLNDVLFPASVTGPVTATWRHRDKTESTMRDWYDTNSYGPETGVTYKVEWYNHDTSTLLQSTTGITGTSDSWTDDGNSYNLRLEITAQRGGVDSYETFVFMTAFSQGVAPGQEPEINGGFGDNAFGALPIASESL